MSATHAYLIGILGLGVIFSMLCRIRKDLRKAMLYGGTLYLGYGFIMFLAIRLLASDSAKMINPGYWTPPSLFGINTRSGGYGIEDALFSFFAAGIAVGLYDTIFNLKISKRTNGKLKKGHTLLFALLVGSAVLLLSPLNAIYFFISLQFFGAVAIVWQRRDLLLHALVGGTIFMLLYVLFYAIFLSLFPHFLDYYHLERTSHISLLRVPLEEFLYGLSLGMMWAPIYEYEFRLKDSKRRSLGLRRLALGVGGAKR
jgi:hypothetical protein